MGTIYVQHVNRINYLKRYLSNLIEIWECEWDQMVKESDELKQFIKNEDDIRLDLKPRDALFGGRTNSAVPSLMKTCRFPIGFPRLITENFENIKNYFGLIHCKVVPPTKLLFPVLPSRIDN